jgi:hypothetical protein
MDILDYLRGLRPIRDTIEVSEADEAAFIQEQLSILVKTVLQVRKDHGNKPLQTIKDIEEGLAAEAGMSRKDYQKYVVMVNNGMPKLLAKMMTLSGIAPEVNQELYIDKMDLVQGNEKTATDVKGEVIKDGDSVKVIGIHGDAKVLDIEVSVGNTYMVSKCRCGELMICETFDHLRNLEVEKVR